MLKTSPGDVASIPGMGGEESVTANISIADTLQAGYLMSVFLFLKGDVTR
jgi:hypothetical protein